MKASEDVQSQESPAGDAPLQDQPSRPQGIWDRLSEGLREWVGRHAIMLVVSALVALFLIIYLAPETFIAIYPGQAGVLWHRFYRGQVMDKVYGEGTHVILPWDRMYIYDLRVHDIEDTVHLLTIDGLEVAVTLHARVRLDLLKLPRINETVGPDYEKQVVIPQMEAATRAVLSRYQPEQLHVHDEETLSRDIQSTLAHAPNMDLIGIETVNITKIALPDGVEKSIEAKNEEEQKSLLFDYRLQEERKEAERKKIEAQGIKDFEDTLSGGISQQYLLLRAIQATEALATSPNSKMIIVGSGQDGLPVIMGNQMGAAIRPRK